MDMKQRIADLAAEMLHTAFPEAENLPDDLAALLEVPPDPALGDYAFPCFKLSRALRMGPPAIAQKMAAADAHPEVARVECVGGYLNFFFNRVTGEKLAMDARLYNSLMVQLLLADPQDPRFSPYFKLLYDNVFARVYEVM